MTKEEIEDAELTAVEGREIGIDLGTTNSVVSYIESEQLKTLEIRNQETIPSVIFFKSPTDMIFGERAFRRGIQYPKSVAKLFKRKLTSEDDKIQIEFSNSGERGEDSNSIGQTYVIDTNIFIDEPYILDKFNNEDKIVVADTVFEELENRTGDQDTEYQAEEAINKINQNDDELVFANSDTSLLPEDFFKQDQINNERNDNLILSVALSLEEENPILLTSDKGLQTKAKRVDIDCKSLSDFQLDKPLAGIEKNDVITLTGEESSAHFLRYLKDEATKELGEISKAVITVPANFNNVEIEATKRAGKRAGFEEIKILKEPTAAAIAYGYEERENKKILVYDFGGGTFDVSIIEAQGDETFKVLNTGGNSSLGGEDLTQELIHFIYDKLYDEFDLDMEDEDYSDLSTEEFRHNKAEIYREAEQIKRDLSVMEDKEFSLPNIYTAEEEQRSYSIKISRDKFEDLIRDQIIEAREAMQNTISETNVLAEDINIIVLAGGTSSLPIIQQKVKEFFGQNPNYNKDTATVIAQGAALMANDIWNTENTIQNQIQIIDKTIDDFGVSVKGRKFDLLIPFGTELPTTESKEYSPVRDNQEEIRIKVFSRDKNCQSSTRVVDQGVEYLDEILISNLPPLKQYEMDIKVTFKLTKEYILEVDAEIKDEAGNLIDTANLEVQKESTS